MAILFHKHFLKRYEKLRMGEKRKIKEKIKLFMSNPFSPELNNHPLLGKYSGYRSINVGGDLRLIYKEIKPGVFFIVNMGSHSGLYS